METWYLITLDAILVGIFCGCDDVNELKHSYCWISSVLHLGYNDFFINVDIWWQTLCRILNDEDGDIKEGILGTPIHISQNSEPFDSTPQTNGKIHSSGKPSKLITPFGQRTNKFVVKSSIKNVLSTESGREEPDHEYHEDDIIRKVRPGRRCSLTVHGSKPETGCRFMYDRIEDRVCENYYSIIWLLFGHLYKMHWCQFLVI